MSLYRFNSTSGMQDNLWQEMIGPALLDYDFKAAAKTVARRIEAAFDAMTLFAFARAPEASDDTVTITEAGRFIYVYNPKMLLMLLLPLIATFIGCWGRLWVGGSEVPGCDIVRIAKMGPVAGLEHKESSEMEDLDDVQTRCVDEGSGRMLVVSRSGADEHAYHNVSDS